MKIMVVGSGLAGAMAARMLADAGHRAEVFETRQHIGGNCYDAWQDGVRVHQYGPHCFHTNKREVWDFVNRFATFLPRGFEVVANTRLGMIPIPFNDVSAELVGDVTPEEIRELFVRRLQREALGYPVGENPTVNHRAGAAAAGGTGQPLPSGPLAGRASGRLHQNVRGDAGRDSGAPRLRRGVVAESENRPSNFHGINRRLFRELARKTGIPFAGI